MIVKAEPGEKVTSIKLLQPPKALPPIVMTLAGIVTEFNSLQLIKALSPILVQSAGMSTCPAESGVIAQLDEVSIGHALISDALYFGLENTIQRYKLLLQ